MHKQRQHHDEALGPTVTHRDQDRFATASPHRVVPGFEPAAGLKRRHRGPVRKRIPERRPLRSRHCRPEQGTDRPERKATQHLVVRRLPRSRDQIDHRPWGCAIKPELDCLTCPPRLSYPGAIAQGLLQDGFCPVGWSANASTVRLPAEAMAKQSVGKCDNLCAPNGLGEKVDGQGDVQAVLILHAMWRIRSASTPSGRVQDRMSGHTRRTSRGRVCRPRGRRPRSSPRARAR